MDGARRLPRPAEGLPVYSLVDVPDGLSLNVVRFDGGPCSGVPALQHPHVHDFLVLAFFEQTGGSLRLGGRRSRVEAGDAYLVAPGDAVGGDGSDMGSARGWAVSFPPDVFGPPAAGSFFAWRAHPLLFPFVPGTAPGARRLVVPEGARADWGMRLSALEHELWRRQGGYREAVLANLTLLLVAVGRLAGDTAADLRLTDEPLLADVFGFIERQFADPISLKDVARAVCRTPGHLTTVVGHRTGRTVQEWIAERRMAEARRLLAETDLAVGEVGRRVGYPDPGYFARRFRAAHGVAPSGWRRAGRPGPVPPYAGIDAASRPARNPSASSARSAT